MNEQLRLFFIYTLFIGLTASSCSLESSKLENEGRNEFSKEKEGLSKKEGDTPYNEPHQYGGWFCPDNLKGFPPADITKLDEIQVVNGRLPTQEECKDGRALMYIDNKTFPDAKPLNIELPSLGKVSSDHNGFDELVIIIQASIIGNDTVVGYRFPSGGNGSAWYGEVDFLDNTELKELSAQPFVHIKKEIIGSKSDVWDAFSKSAYAVEIGDRYNVRDSMTSEWTGVPVSLESLDEGRKSKGFISDMWGMIYMQIDTKKKDYQFTEKLMISENENEGVTHLELVIGPYLTDVNYHHMKWMQWADELTHLR